MPESQRRSPGSGRTRTTARRRSRQVRPQPASGGGSAERRLASDTVDMGKLHGYLGYLLRRAQMLAYADFIEELAALNLSPGEFGVLTVIDTNPGLRQGQVSSALGIQKTNFVAVLNELERRGIAVREAAARDRRSHALYLTPAGKALLRRARAAQSRHESRLVAPLGEHGRARLIALLEKLTRGR